MENLDLPQKELITVFEIAKLSNIEAQSNCSSGVMSILVNCPLNITED